MNRRTDVTLSVTALGLTALAFGGIAAFGLLDAFGAWAWAQHHNILSWWARPLFLLPFAWFAWRRSLLGLTCTLIALGTSMFWFPAPDVPSPAVIEMLDLERAYLTSDWTLTQILIGLLVPITFGALAVALWRRSLGWGIGVINGMVLFKVAWTFIYTPGAGALLHMLPALVGLAVVDVVIAVAVRFFRKRGHPTPTPV